MARYPARTRIRRSRRSRRSYEIGADPCRRRLGAGGRPGTATRYGPAGLFGGYGERVVEPGVWRVSGRSNGVAETGFGRNMAMYRAAALVRAAGFSHMQILDQRGRENRMNSRTIGESLELWVRGAGGPAPPADCRARNPQACFTISVDEIMARLRPLLHIDPAPAPAPGGRPQRHR